MGGTVAAGKRDHQHLLEALSQLRGGNPPDLKDCEREPAQPPKPAPKKAPKPPPAKAAVGRMRERRPTRAGFRHPAGLSRAAGRRVGRRREGAPNAATRTTAGTSIRRVP